MSNFEITNSRHIDPLLSPIILYVLRKGTNTRDIPVLFLDFLKKCLDTCAIETTLDKQSSFQRKKKRRCNHTLKISTYIASFVSEILTYAIEIRPKVNIVEFLIAIVERLIRRSNLNQNDTNICHCIYSCGALIFN